MANMNYSSEFIFSAPERELLTLSIAEIIDGLMADYKNFSHKNDAGIRIPEKKQEPRMSHSCILYAEGLRLAHTHLNLAKKLILASLFDFVQQANYWFMIERKSKEEEEKAKAEGKLIEKTFDLIEALSELNHYSTRAIAWLDANDGTDELRILLREIKAFEDFKTAMRKKEADENKKRQGKAE